jgi:hypothetical protein
MRMGRFPTRLSVSSRNTVREDRIGCRKVCQIASKPAASLRRRLFSGSILFCPSRRSGSIDIPRGPLPIKSPNGLGISPENAAYLSLIWMRPHGVFPVSRKMMFLRLRFLALNMRSSQTIGANKIIAAPGQLLDCERFSKRSRACLRRTEHPKALPASRRCPGQPRV